MGQSPYEPPDARDPHGAVVGRIGHDRTAIERMCNSILAAMHSVGYADAQQFAMRLAWEEAISNAIHHGNQDRPNGRIDVAYRINSDRAYVRITDEGAGFDPDAITDPTLDENLECPTGRGLLLMRAYMTRVEIQPPGNTVRLVLERKPTE